MGYEFNTKQLSRKQRKIEKDTVKRFIKALQKTYKDAWLVYMMEIVTQAGAGFDAGEHPIEVLEAAIKRAEEIKVEFDEDLEANSITIEPK